MNFNNLKNLCDFIDNREQFIEQFTAECDSTEVKRLAAEHMFNLIAEADVIETTASDLADVLADKYFSYNKQLKTTDRASQ